ncbi:MAG TPA: excinuclease ABC subunit UvrC [Arcobacter sp.]|nr:excinuclease ABC subunit UvrC [Arcobacter sp.]HIP55638.1 excinuclease ABC subunit UvrC [Arcobacter sp.]
MNLEEKLKNLPSNPGVYQYFDKNGRLLYVGKAKVLKNRVKSYFQFKPTLAPSSKLGPRIYKMISEVQALDYIVVPNENDALILENSLIKQLKPKYNILLRDDKTYPYIYIDTSEDFPRLDITRKVIKSKDIKYFGPFSIGARDMLDSIYEILPLVQKKSCLKEKKACLFYQMKKCLAPCEGKVSKQEYAKLIEKALLFIHNKVKLIVSIEEKMEFYSENFRFEEALVLRDRIKTIEKSHIKSTLDFANNENLDLFAVQIKEQRAVIIKMFVREGKLISSSHNYINITEISSFEDIYKTAIINYYSSDLPYISKDILVAHTIKNKEELESFISTKYNKKVNITQAKIGRKKDLTNVAIQNCNELLKVDNSIFNAELYITLKDLFNLDKVSYRYEAYDNSHIMGQATVGAMIVWDENKFIKEDYRLYNLEAKDEYAQMREMLTRRVLKFKENPPPDVWIIDGGKTLITLANDILQSVGVTIDVIGIAKEKIDKKANRSKGSARDILYIKNEVFKLETSDKRLHFCQRLRDEVHRCAIGFHKKQKRKEDKQISLLQVKGIGPAKVAKLLNFFGTFETVKSSSLDELKEVLNEKDAILLENHFKE